MSRPNLRRKPRVSYYEPEEPSLDEYVFCESCGDYVYEYCSIHGPLLVIPDDKVPAKTGLPPYVPRSALTIPHVFLHLAHSVIPGAGLGVFATLTLPVGVRFGPYRGARATHADSAYCWQMYDRDNKPSHVVDAADANKSNWMRYVNCARHWREQNLVAYQYRGQLYYRTIKIIPRFTELMVFYGSEFAKILNIDLLRYNSPPGYAQKFGAPVLKKPRLECNSQKTLVKEIDQTTPENENTSKNQQSIPELKDNSDVNSSIKKPQETEKRKPCTQKVCVENDINNNIGSKEFICNDCGAQFRIKEQLISHIKTHTKGIYHYCPECTFKDITLDSLKNHMRFHDKKRLHVCNVCNYRFQSKSKLNSHIKCRHSNEKLYSCDICPYKSSSEDDVNNHLINVHAGGNRISNVCNSTQENSKKPYVCNICQHRFTLKHVLIRHMRIHSGEKPYTCNICQYRCIRKYVLTVHMRIHSGEKPYACNICQHRFTQKIVLITHMRIHSGEKPYACNICQHRFKQKNHLTDHMRIHSGEKPYACNICQHRFTRKNVLLVHMRIHSGEKPYACNICQHRFTQKHVLIRHMRIHSGEKPYACNMCSYRSAYKQELKKHINKNHMNN